VALALALFASLIALEAVLPLVDGRATRHQRQRLRRPAVLAQRLQPGVKRYRPRAGEVAADAVAGLIAEQVVAERGGRTAPAVFVQTGVPLNVVARDDRVAVLEGDAVVV